MDRTKKEATAICLTGLLLLLLGVLPVHADSRDEVWALELTEKELDENTGTLRLRFKNTSMAVPVTAFGVAVVYDGGEGRSGTRVVARELLPGEPLAPGANYEMDVPLFGPSDARSSSFVAATALLHFEILSDRSSHGNEAYVAKTFAARAAFVAETKRYLAQLQRVRTDDTRENALSGFWSGEAERRQNALHELQAAEQLTERVRNELQAILSLTDLAQQIQERVAIGTPVDDALDLMEEILREQYLKPLLEGIRPQDTAAQHEEPGGAE